MGRLIRDGLLGVVAAMTILVVWAGLQGYFGGIALDGPDKNFGLDGAGTMIVLAVLFYGLYVAAFGLVAGLVVGLALRQWKAERRG